MIHPGLAIFHRAQTARSESWKYECMACGRVFHTCGDNPRARCNRCTLLGRPVREG